MRVGEFINQIPATENYVNGISWDGAQMAYQQAMLARLAQPLDNGIRVLAVHQRRRLDYARRIGAAIDAAERYDFLERCAVVTLAALTTTWTGFIAELAARRWTPPADLDRWADDGGPAVRKDAP